MSSPNPAIKMPSLARNLIDTNALATFNAWIDSLGGPPTLAPPAVSPTPGIYTNQVVLTVQPPDANSTLYYTLDGSLPTTNSPPYLAPLTLDYAATFTVNAFEANYVNSIAVGGSYTIVPPLNSFFAPSLLANGSFEMQYWANPNQTYILQSSTDLVNWISVSTNTPAAAPFQWLDSPPTPLLTDSIASFRPNGAVVRVTIGRDASLLASAEDLLGSTKLRRPLASLRGLRTPRACECNDKVGSEQACR